MWNIGKLGWLALCIGPFLAPLGELRAQTTGSTTGGIGSGAGIGSGSRIGSGTGIGTSGSSFTGGAAGTGVPGTSFSGAMGGTGRATSAGANIPSTSNVFSGAYSNPTGMTFVTPNIPTSSIKPATKAFGQPVYSIAIGTAGTAVGAGSVISGINDSFSTAGIRRAPPFTTVLAPDIPRVRYEPATVHFELTRSLQTAPFLKDRNIEVSLDNGVVVLQGQVASERERRIAEGVARLTPGVREVRNELVAPPAPSPTDE